jgi:hypothetical protein
MKHRHLTVLFVEGRLPASRPRYTRGEALTEAMNLWPSRVSTDMTRTLNGERETHDRRE